MAIAWGTRGREDRLFGSTRTAMTSVRPGCPLEAGSWFATGALLPEAGAQLKSRKATPTSDNLNRIMAPPPTGEGTMLAAWGTSALPLPLGEAGATAKPSDG